jgi:DNA invertase Pin-like site-specific DNA recombinase
MIKVIYVRVSSDEQVNGTSLDHQEKMCRQYCKEKSCSDIRFFREEGASAKSTERKEFVKALEFCRKSKGKVDEFIVYKLDRFTRNSHDHFVVRKMLKDCGVRLVSVTEPISDDPAGKVFEEKFPIPLRPQAEQSEIF